MKNLRFVLLCAVFLIYGCEKPNFTDDAVSPDGSMPDDAQLRKGEKITYSDGELELGEKVENAYTIENMKKALQNLRKSSDTYKELKIEPNYYYVRVLPKTNAEYDLVNNDETIDIYEYPLDYKIKKQGNKYRDKTLGNDAPFTWLYCAVPTKKQFDKSLQVEVLEKLFLPFGNGRDDEYAKSVDSLSSEEKAFLEGLENEALRLTGNLDTNAMKKGKVTTWYASGRIRVWDDLVHYNEATTQLDVGGGWVPVPQCMVRANRGFTTKTTISNPNGTFIINHGWGNGDAVDYSIKWERADFDIRSGNYGQAYFNGPNQFGSWNLDIPGLVDHDNDVSTPKIFPVPENFIYAHVHRGAYEYYYRNFIYGVQQPSTAGLLGGKMHLGAKQETCNNSIYPDVFECRAHYFDWNSLFAAAEIRLPFDLSRTENDSRGIFETTIHELAHASHWRMGFTTGLYAIHTNNRKLAESWAQMVGWQITNLVYASDPFDFDEFTSRQWVSLNDMPNEEYTPLFIDLIDNFNQSTTSPIFPNENVTGYTLGQLESFLIQRPTNWYQLRDYIVDHNLPTQDDIGTQNLFNNYDK